MCHRSNTTHPGIPLFGAIYDIYTMFAHCETIRRKNIIGSGRYSSGERARHERARIRGGFMDLRRYPRFDFGGTAMLVFDDVEHRRTLAITNFRNISQAGACVLTPEANGFSIGDQLFLMPDKSRQKREAMVINLGTGRLHLELPRSQELSEFEVAQLLQALRTGS
jgi:hypothetical protein